MKFTKKLSAKINPQSLLVSLCILAVCITTQQIQTVAWYTGIIEFSRDSLGVLMAVIIMTNYHINDFKTYKLPYIIWSVLGIVLSIIFVPAAIAKRDTFLMADTIIIALGIFLMGYCIIHTLISLFIEKYRPKFYLPLFIIWLVMLILMIFSKSDYIWPECYFVLFLCYYMTKQTSAQRTNVMRGIINGIILAFITIQAHSLLFRPYDRARYQGNFCNPNNNCLFLCICLAAILAKILSLTKENDKKIVKVIFYLLAGSCYSLICMTASRSGYLATVVLTIFFLIAYCKIREKRMFIRMGLLLVLIFAVMLPTTYLAVRYIPTIHPHVLFYFQEGYSEVRVHSWDDRESPKYISFTQMLESIMGRFVVLPSDTNSNGEKPNDKEGASLETESAATTPFPGIGSQAETDTEPTEVESNKIPVLTYEESLNGFTVRYNIYKWFFTHLSLRGMPYDEQGFQLTKTYWVQHAHNIYLDYGINFGYPVMILFTVFIWWGIGRLTTQGLKSKDIVKLSCLLIALIPSVFGIFEYAWGAGLISTVSLYLTFKEMFAV